MCLAVHLFTVSLLLSAYGVSLCYFYRPLRLNSTNDNLANEYGYWVEVCIYSEWLIRVMREQVYRQVNEEWWEELRTTAGYDGNHRVLPNFITGGQENWQKKMQK